MSNQKLINLAYSVNTLQIQSMAISEKKGFTKITSTLPPWGRSQPVVCAKGEMKRERKNEIIIIKFKWQHLNIIFSSRLRAAWWQTFTFVSKVRRLSELSSFLGAASEQAKLSPYKMPQHCTIDWLCAVKKKTSTKMRRKRAIHSNQSIFIEKYLFVLSLRFS